MKDYRKKVRVTCLVILVCCSVGWASDYEDDALMEAEAQKDMLAYVQSTFPSRFGDDLQVGDYVQYEITDHHHQDSDPELNSLEVTDRQNNVVTIKEEFEGNILFYKVDLSGNTLLEYWGYDEEGREHRPAFLSASEVESRMKSMVGQDARQNHPEIPAEFAKPRFTILSQRETINIGRTNLNCEVKALEVPNVQDITFEIRNAIQEVSKILLSDSVPKMLPAKLMATYLDNPELFDTNTGLVKESKYRIIDFSKSER
ncbi:MAG: hypothetical protein PHY24_08565 [Candidatus Cloacimonetes bacterium]|nr:hypothetical protein [Candidatus Cloacimonadota bacterium]